MATGRTVSASFLTDLDRSVIELSGSIASAIKEIIPLEKDKLDFEKEFGKVNLSRDAGAGRGAGKLQRDAICTRGRQGKAPFSNRNLRWHPLVVAEDKPSYAKEIDRIEIEGVDEAQTLVFFVKDSSGKELRFPADRVHEMPERFVALPKHWIPHVPVLKNWNDTLWTQNSCVIPALEACRWQDAVETFASLGISAASVFYGADLKALLAKVTDVLSKQKIDTKLKLPTENFPRETSEILSCPVCRLGLSEDLERFRKERRETTWQPSWRPSKKSEGDDGSVQILHVVPLVESENRHNVSNVRYGHRWCNVAMTDHSLEETIDFMDFVVKAHKS